MSAQQKFIPPATHNRAILLACIPLIGTILFYLMLQSTGWPLGVIAIALCPLLATLVYQVETQRRISQNTLLALIAAAFCISILSVFALIAYELWGIYAYELGGADNTLGQTFLEFVSTSLATETVWHDYTDEFVWGFVAYVAGVAGTALWVDYAKRA